MFFYFINLSSILWMILLVVLVVCFEWLYIGVIFIKLVFFMFIFECVILWMDVSSFLDVMFFVLIVFVFGVCVGFNMLMLIVIYIGWFVSFGSIFFSGLSILNFEMCMLFCFVYLNFFFMLEWILNEYILFGLINFVVLWIGVE